MILVRALVSNIWKSKDRSFCSLSSINQNHHSILPTKPFLVSIEGNIGAGKSTLINHLKTNHLNCNYIEEPLAIWSTIKNDDGRNLLETYYSDRNRWSFTFQMCALLSRFKSIEGSVTNGGVPFRSSSDKSVFVSERCLDTDYHCFTKMLHSDGAISGMEMKIYEQYYDHFLAMSTPLSAIIHVDTNPEMCHERIKQRNRRGEDEISIEYLRALDYWTRKWIESTNVPVLSINPSGDGKEKIDAFIEKCIADSCK